MRRTLYLLTFFTIAGCSQPAAPGRAGSTLDTPRSLTQRCTNTTYRFSVSYPAGWHTNDGSVLPACSVFDPEPVQLPAQSEIPFEISVTISVQDRPFEPAITSSQWERVLSTETLRLGGRNALSAEVEATGEGLADRGMRSLRYVVDLGGGRTLVASTHATGASYPQEKEILARMVESITLE